MKMMAVAGAFALQLRDTVKTIGLSEVLAEQPVAMAKLQFLGALYKELIQNGIEAYPDALRIRGRMKRAKGFSSHNLHKVLIHAIL